MDIYDVLQPMLELVRSGQWEELEAHYHRVCTELAGEKTAQRIASVQPKKYIEQMREKTAEALRMAAENSFSAIAYEYDLDNSWEGHWLLCADYDPDEESKLEWWEGVPLSAPECPQFGKLYREDFSESKRDVGVNAYLIARTAAIIGRIVAALPDDGLAITSWFHDGEDFRVTFRERERRIAPKEVHDKESDLVRAIRVMELGGKADIAYRFLDRKGAPAFDVTCSMRRQDGSEILKDQNTNSGGDVYYFGLTADVAWEMTVRDDDLVLLKQTVVPEPGPQQLIHVPLDVEFPSIRERWELIRRRLERKESQSGS